MKKLAKFISFFSFLSFLYLVVGLYYVHVKIAGSPPTPNYYQNIALGVMIGTLVVVYLGLLVLLFRKPDLILERVRNYIGLTLMITLLGFFYSSGQYGGTFIPPQGFGFLIPTNLFVLGLISNTARSRIVKEEED